MLLDFDVLGNWQNNYSRRSRWHGERGETITQVTTWWKEYVGYCEWERKVNVLGVICVIDVCGVNVVIQELSLHVFLLNLLSGWVYYWFDTFRIYHNVLWYDVTVMDNKQFTPSAEQFVYATAVIKYYLHSPFLKLSDNWLTEDDIAAHVFGIKGGLHPYPGAAATLVTKVLPWRSIPITGTIFQFISSHFLLACSLYVLTWK